MKLSFIIIVLVIYSKPFVYLQIEAIDSLILQLFWLVVDFLLTVALVVFAFCVFVSSLMEVEPHEQDISEHETDD